MHESVAKNNRKYFFDIPYLSNVASGSQVQIATET